MSAHLQLRFTPCFHFSNFSAKIQTSRLDLDLPSKIDAKPEITLQALTEECQRLLNLKHDTQQLQEKNEPLPRTVCKVSQEKYSHPQLVRFSGRRNFPKPPSRCWNCGDWHYVKDCLFHDHVSFNCGIAGHKESHCTTRKSRPKEVFLAAPT